MKKKYITIALLATMCLSIAAGCSQPAEQTVTDTSNTASQSNAQTDTSKNDKSKPDEKSTEPSKNEISEVSETEISQPETEPEKYTIDNIRNYVVGVNEPVELSDGTTRPLINFDNAATTPVLKPVQQAVDKEFEMYGSIGRGFSQKSNHSTELYNSVRDKVLNFVGADDNYTCFYVNNTTDGLNKLASALVESEDDIVLSTRIEHHANDLSWRERCKTIYAEVDENGRVIYDDIEKMLKENDVKYVAITAASNVTGYVTDVHRVAKLAHQYGAKIIVDGAQIVAHRKFSMIGDTPEENIDFLVFSAHKMYSPYGGGAVIGLKDVLNEHMPEFYGGGIVTLVKDDEQYYKDATHFNQLGAETYTRMIIGDLRKIIDK